MGNWEYFPRNILLRKGVSSHPTSKLCVKRPKHHVGIIFMQNLRHKSVACKRRLHYKLSIQRLHLREERSNGFSHCFPSINSNIQYTQVKSRWFIERSCVSSSLLMHNLSPCGKIGFNPSKNWCQNQNKRHA